MDKSEGQLRDKRLGLPRVLLWSSPAIALGALGLPIAMFVPNFYVEQVGVSPAMAGLVFLLLRIWDGVTDPALGVLSDRLSPPIGRRKFWVVVALPLLALSVWMILVPLPGAGAMYLGGWLACLYVGVTAMQVNHISWGAELTVDYDDRSRFMGWYELSVILGLVVLLVIAAVLETGVAEEQMAEQRAETLRILALFLIGLFIVTSIPLLLLVREGRAHEENTFSLKGVMAAVRANPDLRRTLIANFCYRAATGVSGTLFLWYVGTRLGLVPIAAAIMALYFLSGFVGMPFWMWLARLKGKRWTFVFAMSCALAITLPFAFLNGQSPVLGNANTIVFEVAGLQINVDQFAGIILTVLIGLTFGAAPFLSRAIIADLTKAEQSRSGENHTGFFYALLQFSEKFGFAVAAGGAVAMLSVIGFATGEGAEPTAASVQRLALVYAVIPAVLFVMAGFFAFRTTDVHQEQTLH